MKRILLLIPFLVGCAATQERTQQWGDTKLENNAAHYQQCKRHICELSYTETVRMLENYDLTAWELFCFPDEY